MRLKGYGSSSTLIGGGSVGPKRRHNSVTRKGNRLISRYRPGRPAATHAPFPTGSDRHPQKTICANTRSPGNDVTSRTGRSVEWETFYCLRCRLQPPMKRERRTIRVVRTKNRNRCPWQRKLSRRELNTVKEFGKLEAYLRYKP